MQVFTVKFSKYQYESLLPLPYFDTYARVVAQIAVLNLIKLPYLLHYCLNAVAVFLSCVSISLNK